MSRARSRRSHAGTGDGPRLHSRGETLGIQNTWIFGCTADDHAVRYRRARWGAQPKGGCTHMDALTAKGQVSRRTVVMGVIGLAAAGVGAGLLGGCDVTSQFVGQNRVARVGLLQSGPLSPAREYWQPFIASLRDHGWVEH